MKHMNVSSNKLCSNFVFYNAAVMRRLCIFGFTAAHVIPEFESECIADWDV